MWEEAYGLNLAKQFSLQGVVNNEYQRECIFFYFRLLLYVYNES